MTSQEQALKNSQELLEFFKDKWTEEQYQYQHKLQAQAQEIYDTYRDYTETN